MHFPCWIFYKHVPWQLHPCFLSYFLVAFILPPFLFISICPGFLYIARLLADSGAEGLPCSSALWESGHKHTWKRLPCGQVWTLLQVSIAFIWDELAGMMGRCITVYKNETTVISISLRRCRHGWNLTVLPNNSGSILRHLGAVPGEFTIVVCSRKYTSPHII